MNRKEFLQKMALASLAVNFPLLDVFSQQPPFKLEAPEDLALVSVNLQKKIDAVFSRLEKTGWFDYLRERVPGLPDKMDGASIASVEIGNLESLHTQYGFEDFGGNKLIEPGYPALSLIYHLLCNPRVRPENIDRENYPTLEEIDIVEDYIYALKKWSFPENEYKEKLVFAIFAYEYRTGHKTPHHRCADLVFSRTGIGRIGNKPEFYNQVERCYTNSPSANILEKDIAVVPVKYGLFLARLASKEEVHAMKMARDMADCNYLAANHDYPYLIPLRKIFSDDTLVNHIEFTESHLSIKLSRLMETKEFLERKTDLVKSRTTNSTFWVCSKEDDLICEVRDKDGKLVSKSIPVSDNRYFTTRYSGKKSVESIYIHNSNGSRVINKYDDPRNIPMYLNISHQIRNDKIESVPRTTDKEFESYVLGKIDVPIFSDNICDGRIDASVSIPPNSPIKWMENKVLSAFSIVTAPDFMPQVDGFDLQDFDTSPGKNTTKTLFYEGSIASLATCKIAPNPIVYEKWDTSMKRFANKETYTSVFTDVKAITNPAQFDDPNTDKGYFFSSHLPDMCSSIFAPGWDVTYSSHEKDVDSIGPCGNEIFLSTQGLGAPFVEDMKLCAAMNGMWPAASPDASRTYQGSVLKSEKSLARNPTAIPLMDLEIGCHRFSPAVIRKDIAECDGWDGEQGPFLELHNKSYCINFTDLGRADYVDNALNNKFSMALLRRLDSRELNRRMRCLIKCTDAHPARRHYPNGSDDVWLVSAEQVKWGTNKAVGYGIPNGLFGQPNLDWVINPRPGINGEGYLFVFANYKADKVKEFVAEEVVKRRRIKVDRLYICQVTPTAISYYESELKLNQKYNGQNWK